MDNLHPDHLADLYKSGLSDDTITAAGLYSVPPREIKKITQVSKVTSLLAFPYPGEPECTRYKVFPVHAKTTDGKSFRYVQRKASGVYLYIPPAARAVLKDPDMPLGIVEGEKKALKGCQEGIVCLAIGGIWNWSQDGRMLGQFDDIALQGRQVPLYPDSDVWKRPDLRLPVYRLGRALEAKGAQVTVCILPNGPGETKLGLDDYLVSHRAEELQALPHIPLTDRLFGDAQRREHDREHLGRHEQENHGSASGSGATNGGGEIPQTPYSDQFNAEAFVQAHGQDLRYCERWKRWLIWDGKRWVIDEQGQVMRWAKATVKQMAARLTEIKGKAECDALLAHIKRSLSLRSLEAMVKSAQSEPGIAVTSEMFDQNPWLFNVQNGTLDLRTGELRPHHREDLLMKLSPIPFLDEATCPTWEAFLKDIYAGDQDLIDFDQKAMGYTMTGETREQALFICHGTGSNGKSTKLSVMREIMGEGEYALRTNLQAFTESTAHHQPASIEYYIAKLQGVRFAYASENEESVKLSEGLVKDVTGGTDFITGRHPYGAPFSFRPLFKLWLGTNHEPIIRGTDHAIWRRQRKIPFTVSFEGREDKELFSKLCQELTGILRWAVKGCLLWQMSGLEPPKAVKDATEAYRRAMDVVGRFLDECCTVTPYAKAESTALYQAYVKWCAENGEQALSQRKLADRLRERGLHNDGPRDSITRRIMWVGLGLLNRTQGGD